MSNILLVILMIYGLTNAIIYTDGPFYIFSVFRKLMNFLPSNLGHAYECSICFPFQLGVVFSLINTLLLPNIVFTPSYYILSNNEYWYLMMILDGAFFSGVNWLLHTCQEAIERTNNYENEIIE